MSTDSTKPGLSRRLLSFFEHAVTDFYAGGFTPQPGSPIEKLTEKLSTRPAMRVALTLGLNVGGLLAVSAMTGPLTLGHVAVTWLWTTALRAGYGRLNKIAPGLNDEGKPFVDAVERDAVVAARRQKLVERASNLSNMAGSPNIRASKPFMAALSDLMWQSNKTKYMPQGVEGEAGFWRRPSMRLVQNLAVPLIGVNLLGLGGVATVLLVDHLRRRMSTENNALLQRKHGSIDPSAGSNDNPLLPPNQARGLAPAARRHG